MSVNLVPLERAHVQKLSEQGNQVQCAPIIANPAHLAAFKAAGACFAAVAASGRVLLVGGMIECEERPRGRAICWAMIEQKLGSDAVLLYRALMQRLDEADYRRLEMPLPVILEAGPHRLMRMLGFRREATLKSYTPEGGSAELYARINPNWKPISIVSIGDSKEGR